MEIRPHRGFPQRLEKSLTNNARLFHRSHSPDGGITSNFFDIHPGGGPNQSIEVGQIKLTNSLLVVVGTDARFRLFTQLLNHPKFQRIVPGSSVGLASVVKLYRVRRAVPVIRLLEPISRELRELRALGVVGDRQPDWVQQSGKATHNDASHKNGQGFWIE